MATGKRYFWIKLKDSFMTSDTIDFFMSQPDGANYVVLYQMLLLKTINTEGRLERQIGEVIIPYDVEKIQRDCKFFTVDTIRVALQLYQAVGLIYEDTDGTLVMRDHNEMVGSETDFAKQKREQRRSVMKQDETLLVDNGVDNVHTDNRDKDKEINNIYIVGQILELLNKKCGTNYKSSSKNTQKHISARLNEGYTLDDFKTVIEKKCKEWKGSDMEKYLRPETLFGNKFEGYLNQKETVSQNKTNNFHNFEEHCDSLDYDPLANFDKMMKPPEV